SPRCMISFAVLPRGVPWATFARSRSPVEIWGISQSCTNSLAWVPLPTPGAPSRRIGPGAIILADLRSPSTAFSVLAHSRLADDDITRFSFRVYDRNAGKSRHNGA